MTGCFRKCPCPLWVQCPYYINDKRKAERLARKQYNFWEYYDRFGIDWIPDSVGNG